MPFEDLDLVPVDVNDVDDRLSRSRRKQWSASQSIDRAACLAPGDVQARYLNSAVLRNSQHA